jgi:hypothetical protein
MKIPDRMHRLRKVSLAAVLVLANFAHANTSLNPADKSATVSLSGGGLSVTYSGFNMSGVRTDRAIQPGQGVYYFEGKRLAGLANYGFGIATASASLANYGGFDTQSLGVNVSGGIYHGGVNVGGFTSAINDTYGIVLDYRGAHPEVQLIARAVAGGPGTVIKSASLPSISGPVYALVYGQSAIAGVQQTINLGNDLVAAPFTFDPVQALAAWHYRAGETLVLGWNEPPTVAIAGGDRTILAGSQITLGASASAASGTNLSSIVVWTDSASAATGSGAAFTFTPSATGKHTITASVTGVEGTKSKASVVVTVISGGYVDSDRDGLTFDQEVAAGTNPSAADSDADHLKDGVEVNTLGTNPLAADSDADGMPDAFEVQHQLLPLANDSASDVDGDGFTNLAEFTQGTDPRSASSYPGHGIVLLNKVDKYPSVVLAQDDLGAAFPQPGQHAVRSDVSIDPFSGWYYFEGHREAAAGNFGFGVATAAEALDTFGGSSLQSVGLNAAGALFHGASVAGSFSAAQSSAWYGLAIDYSGAHPVVHAIVDQNGTPFLLPPVTMFAVSEPVHIFVYGEPSVVGVQQTINAGADPKTKPFHFPAHYLLFTAGRTGAEFMGTGFGPEHAYAGREKPEQHDPVVLVKEAGTNTEMILAPDSLGVSYVTNHKSAIRANTGMIGEFRYFETRRHIAPINMGQGVITAYPPINPYCCVSTSPVNAPPSMSINSISGIWKNLVFQQDYDTANTTYGFAVDYRGARPIVHVIIGGTLQRTMTLQDVFTPLFPMLYGNPTPPQLANSINFGAKPFAYDARTILQNAGVNVGELVLGWGDANRPENLPVSLAGISIANGSTTVSVGLAASLTATATEVDGNDLSSAVAWSDALGAASGSGATLAINTNLVGVHDVSATVVDADGKSHVAHALITVVDVDTDGDGLFDSQELALGTNRNVADTDGDGMNDKYEVDHAFNPLANDGGLDADSDGFTNFQESVGGSDPRSATSYPGQPNTTFLSSTDKHPSVVLSADRLGARFTGYGNNAVRSDRAVTPGSGFFYFEGRRNIAKGNFGFGIGTAMTSLTVPPGSDATSLGVNALGFVWANGAWSGNLGGEQSSYGIAVDYRGAYPIAYVITSNVVDGPGAVVKTMAMPTVTTPVYIMVGGFALTSGIQSTINAGNDLVAQPFAFDVKKALATAGVAGANQVILGWNPPVPLPTVDIADSALTVLQGGSLTLSASALSLQGQSLTSTIVWTVSGSAVTGSGASFNVPTSTIGVRTITATATDLAGRHGVDQVQIEVLDTDSDGDGLWNGLEAVHGTNPNNPDTDGDGMPDGYEVSKGFNPLANDSFLDADGDGYTNLQEYLIGTDPKSASDFPGMPNYTFLSSTDKHPSVVLSADRLGARFTGYGNNAVRSDRAVTPGSGFFYFEGRRNIAKGNFGFGIGTATTSLTVPPGSDAASFGVNALGFSWWNGAWAGNLGGEQSTYGIAVDYRGAYPIAYVITSNVVDGPGAVVKTMPLPAISTPVYIVVGGFALTSGIQSTINAGNDLLTQPFAYDVKKALTTAGVAGANQVILGWNPPVPAPVVNIADAPATTTLGSSLTLTATAIDLYGNNLGAILRWTDSASAATANGSSFQLPTTSTGIHKITAAVIAGTTVLSYDQIQVEVLDIDTDGDGLFNTDELLHGTNVNVADTDGDGIKDGWEVLHGLNPLANDSALDVDGDGFTNLQEFFADTNPHISGSYPGMPNKTLLSTTDKHASVTVTPDRLGVTFSGYGNCAVRSDASIAPGSGFFYFEGRRNIAKGNFGFGIGLASTALDNNPGRDTTSMGINALGFAWFNGAWAGNLGGDQDVYGLAVDYRGSTPIAYVIASQTLAGPGQLVKTLPLPAVHDPLFIIVHGYALTSGVQQTINTGNDLVSSPFRYNAAAILSAAAVSGASQLNAGWSLPVPKPVVTLGAAPSSLFVGQSAVLTATAVDLHGSNATSSIQWTDSASSATAIGGSFVFTPSTFGAHTIRARVFDPLTGIPGEGLVVINALDVDSDGDGLENHDETAHGTNIFVPDTDGDGMPDGYEVAHAFNPLANDGPLDADGDTFSNFAEFIAGTDPRAADSYPGMPVYTYLSELDKHASVTLSPDKLGIKISGYSNVGVRSDRAILPGSGFFYFEGHREVAKANFGFGVGVASTPLDNHPGRDTTSFDVNALGFTWFNSAWSANLGGSQDTYGIAVDYRGAHPIVYVIVSQTIGGAAAVVQSRTLANVSEPLYFIVHGFAQTSAVQQTVNTGNDLVNRPFTYNAVGALTAAGVAGANQLLLGWH